MASALVMGGTLVISVATAEDITVTTYYPAPAASVPHIRSTDAVFGDAAFKANTPPANGMLVQGAVGIGTTSPTEKLHVHEAAAGTSAYLHLTNATTGAAGGDGFFVGAVGGGSGLDATITNSEAGALLLQTSNTERMRITSTGNVGIGTASPAAKLEINSPVANNSDALMISRIGGAVTGASTTLRGISVTQTSANDTVTNEGIFVTVAHNLNGGATGVNASASTVYSTGIGVLGTGTQNDVNGVGAAIGVKGVASAVRPGRLGSTFAGYFDNTATVGTQNYGVYIKTASAGTYGLYQEGSAPSYFSGNVGIGTTSPTDRLEISGGGILLENGQGIRAYSAAANSGTPTLLALTRNNDLVIGSTVLPNLNSIIFRNGPKRVVIDSSGRVGIGKDPGTTPGNLKLDVNGSITATNVANPSDLRLKTDIHPLTDVLSKLAHLRGVTFHWNDRYRALGYPAAEDQQMGLIAQDLEAAFPELVTTVNGYKAVDYGHFTAVLVEAVKEQQKRIEKQQKEIESLQAEVNSLKRER